MKQKKIVFFIFMLFSATLSCRTAQAGTADLKSQEAEDLYSRLTKEAVCDKGLFNIYSTDGRYYFEIPDSLFGRDMLLVTRRAKSAMDMGFGGELLDERIFTWEKRDARTVDLQARSFRKIAGKGSAMYGAVESTMRPSIITALPVLGYSPDSTSLIVEVSELFRQDDLAFNLADDQKKEYALGKLDKDRSYIKSIRSFPGNIEVRTVKTYPLTGKGRVVETDGLKTVTLELHNSMLLLPEKPMMPRYADERVGFFFRQQWDYSFDDAQRSMRTRYIKRWRLEPSDLDAFRRGELVEPVKPIVYYLSPSIPPQWVKYFKQGVEDWQKAFEQAGFKNAIKALPVPTKEENPDFDPMDARYSMIEYFASYVENSYGPHVSDPRSGEIIESHVCIYHNVMKLVHDWYMVQCGAQDPEGRKMVYSEELMGRMLRFLVAHEVGHTLGLAHNFAASHAYPVDSLRSATFTATHGTAPSIMDYARFNYVSQPEDKVTERFPKIGEYDCYAIEWGYRPILDARTPEDERPVLNGFVKRHADDPRFRYVRQFLIQFDPTAQTEDLGDDPFKATELGLKNLKIVFDSLENWTAMPGHDNRNLEEMYGKACQQWVRYMRHISTYIGGVYENYKSADQPGDVYTPVEKEKQQKAVEFLSRHALEVPEFMASQPYISRFNNLLLNNREIQNRQAIFVDKLLNIGVLLRLTDYYSEHPEEAYNPVDYLKDVREAVWKDLYGKGLSNHNRRVLQRVFMDRCEELVNWKRPKNLKQLDLSMQEFQILVQLMLGDLHKDLKRQSGRTSDAVLQQHYRSCMMKIEKMTDLKK